jgi:hypothetical protein
VTRTEAAIKLADVLTSEGVEVSVKTPKGTPHVLVGPLLSGYMAAKRDDSGAALDSETTCANVECSVKGLCRPCFKALGESPSNARKLRRLTAEVRRLRRVLWRELGLES